MSKGAVWVAFLGAVVICFAITAFVVHLRTKTRAHSAESVDGEELRRLAEMAVTTQEHNDLTLREITAQLSLLREQMDHVQQILKQVE